MLRDSALLQGRPARVLPHVIDTILFVSGLLLAITLHGVFYQQPWLVGKLLAVVFYIVLGAIALRPGRSRAARSVALFLALCIFAYIVLVAHTHTLFP